ncbi:hypothetical protein D3C72_2363310 [compost metagenome]
MIGDHQSHHHQREPDGLAGKFQLREGIGREGTRNHIADHREHGDDGGIPEKGGEAHRQGVPAL